MTEQEVYLFEKNVAEYKEYVQTTPMTAEERKVLQAWIFEEGNSVSENEIYALEEDGRTPVPFLDAHRYIMESIEATKDMTDEERKAYTGVPDSKRSHSYYVDDDLPF